MVLEKAGIVLDTWDIVLLEIIEIKKEVSVGEIQNYIEGEVMTPANLFIHLGRLKAIGFVQERMESQTKYLSLNPKYAKIMPLIKDLKFNLLKSKLKAIYEKKFNQFKIKNADAIESIKTEENQKNNK